MKKFLWFEIKEPFEKLIEKILEAKENKQKIEFAGNYLGSYLNTKQMEKYLQWMEKNKELFKNKVYTETELERLQKALPRGCSIEMCSSEIETYFIFDFR